MSIWACHSRKSTGVPDIINKAALANTPKWNAAIINVITLVLDKHNLQGHTL